MKNLCLVISLVAVVAVLAPAAYSQTGSITANPNPCFVALGRFSVPTCTNTLTWSSQGTTSVEIWVSEHGSTETFMTGTAGGGPYYAYPPWIQAVPDSYVFSLYDSSNGSHGALLGSVTVTGTTAPVENPSHEYIHLGGRVIAVENLTTGTLSASPNPCVIGSGQSLCTTTLTWSSQGATGIQIWVSQNGGAETSFAAPPPGDGHQDANWITAAPDSYVFSLYDYSSGSRGAVLARVTVTGTH